MKKARFRHAHHSPLPAIVLGFATVALSSCSLLNPSDPFSSEYYSSNFISAIGFDVFEGATLTVPATEVSGAWDFPYRYETDWSTYPTAYMKLEAESSLDATFSTPASSGFVSSIPSGLSSAAPVYRLEVANLLSGCDFEGATADAVTARTTSWTTVSGTTSETASSGVFGSVCMSITAAQSSKLSFTPPTSYQFPTTNSYNAFFRYINHDNEAYVEIDDSNRINLSVDASTTPLFAVARFTGEGGSLHPVFTFWPLATAASFNNVLIDNFRVGKTGNMYLRIRLAPANTTPSLVGGVYSFSVWAHPDMNADQSTNSSPYNLDAFVVKMAAVSPATLSNNSASYSYASGSGWQKITATLARGALQFSSGTSSPVLELIIDCNASRPGSVFLAQPELRFYPDGL